jgi:hypothetical protein
MSDISRLLVILSAPDIGSVPWYRVKAQIADDRASLPPAGAWASRRSASTSARACSSTPTRESGIRRYGSEDSAAPALHPAGAGGGLHAGGDQGSLLELDAGEDRSRARELSSATSSGSCFWR